MRQVLRVVVTLVMALAFGAVAVTTSAAPASAAPLTPGFGPAIEGYAAYDPESSCDPSDKPGPIDLRTLLNNAYGTRSTSIGRACTSGTSEHHEGRALDWFVNVDVASDRVIANDIINWLLSTDVYGNRHANFRRLGLMYMIWNRQIWSGYQADDGWRPYSCDGSPTDCHENHIHFSFSWAGARRQTTWWTARIPMPEIAPSSVSAIMHNGALRVFMRWADGTLRQRWLQNGTWSAFQTISGQTITSGPSAVIENGVLRVFARGADGALWRTSWNGQSWLWERVGGALTSHPSAIYWGGALRVFYRGAGGHLFQAYYSGGWHFDDFGRIVQSAPSVVNENGYLRIYSRGGDGALWRTSLEGGAWIWGRVGGVLGSSPSAVMEGTATRVYARGYDGALWRYHWSGSHWLANKVGGVITSGPSAIMHGTVARVFFKGADNQLWQAYYASGRWNFLDLGGSIS
jgi:hypothetical protein